MLARNDNLYEDLSEIDYQTLSSAQRDLIVRRVIREAQAARAAEMLALLRALGLGVSHIARLGVRAAAGAWERYRERQRLRATAARLYAMDDRSLKDIGLRRGEIEFVLSGEVDPTRRPRIAGRARSSANAAGRPAPEQRAA